MSLVEYHDPDGLFPLLSPQLLSRLPLKNLHWKSATRPLRTISTLQLNFVPHASTAEANSKRSQDTTAGSDGRPSLAQGERARRHQIPGLQQTPLLKLYLLRCDDKDAYKASSRKRLRDWLIDHALESRNSGRAKVTEDHDACEWLILHVVLPDTFAATQPRFSKTHVGTESEGSRDRSSSGSKWPGGGSRTILERLRADFNQSSKTSLDRVAQIRLERDALPERWLKHLPASRSTPFPETLQDRENAWSDLMGKFKNLILTSFHLRVTQYEDDIRERDAQRLLPGWNFCTFFVLKEGLARTFESVGLTEDALVAYDELAVGLDAIVRDRSQNQTNLLSPFTTELQENLNKITSDTFGDSDQLRQESNTYSKPLSVDRKDYRTLIVSNDISLFDFQCYIFCRQKTLLLSLSGLHSDLQSGLVNRAVSSKPGSALDDTAREPSTGGEDAVRMSDLGQRTAQFTTSVARVMRDDLWASVDKYKISSDRLELIIDAMVSSWSYSVLQQILDESFSALLVTPMTLHEGKNTKPPVRPGQFPQRHSSLAIRSDRKPPPILHAKDDEELYFSKIDINEITPVKSLDAMNWMAYRADLYLLQRKMLENIGSHLMPSGNDNEKSPNSSRTEDNKDSLDNETISTENLKSDVLARIQTVQTPRLQTALRSPENFKELYELITDRAAWFYSIAARKSSAEQVTYDLANIRLERGEHSKAAKYFSKVISGYESKDWYMLESTALNKYAACLKILNRQDEYIKVMLTMISKAIESRRRPATLKPTRKMGHSNYRSPTISGWQDNGLENIKKYFSLLIAFSLNMPCDYSAPFQPYLEVVEIDRSIQLMDHQDGFRLRIKVKQFVADKLSLDSIKMRLVDGTGSHSREIWVETHAKVELGTAALEIYLQSNTTTLGDLVVDKIIFQAGKILFIKETIVENNREPTLLQRRISSAIGAIREIKGPRVCCYPRAGSLKAVLSESLITRVGGPRTLDLNLQSGLNDVLEGKIILRSASAGLRLYPAEAWVIDGTIEITCKPQPGEVEFGTLKIGQSGTISVPYHSEQPVPDISIRIEVLYSTSEGNYTFSAVSTIKPAMLLDVSVQDVFREKAIYSKFQLKSLTGTGLLLVDASLKGSGLFETNHIMSRIEPIPIFPDLPGALSYKITRRTDKQGPSEDDGNGVSVLFTVAYRHIEDDVLFQSSKILEAGLQKSPFANMQDLLLQTFKSIMQQSMTNVEYERAVSRAEVQLPRFLEAAWLSTVENVPEHLQNDLLHWLEDWYKHNSIVPLLTRTDPSYSGLPLLRQLIVKVDIPELQFLHTASIKLLGGNMTSTLNYSVVAVGQPLAAELRIRHTRRWNRTSEMPDKFSFIYEILFDQARWLVGGQRRVQFEAQEDGELVFKLILVPLIPGQLFLPTVEVSHLPVRKELTADGDDDQSAEDQDQFSSQTDCTSQSCAVLVVRNMRSTTISVGQDDVLTRQMALIESEARVDITAA